MNKQGEHGIEWTDYTLNQMTGCLNGCEYCYARKLANGRLKESYLANNIITDYKALGYSSYYDCLKDPFYPRIWEERFKPLKGYPEGTKIFLDDMSDWMGPWIPDEWKIRTLDFIKAHPQYIFQTLTKQPQNLPKWSPFPENCWVGVTATNGDMFYDALVYLMMIDARVKYISIEPLLDWPESETHFARLALKSLGKFDVDWLIIGAQTRPTVYPKIEWVQEIVEAADKAGTAVFLKNNLMPLFGCDNWFPLWANNGHGGIRQEWPK